MKNINPFQSLSFKLNLVITFSIFMVFNSLKAQLSGPGIEFNTLLNQNLTSKKTFGFDITSETPGMYFNVKNLIGYKQHSLSTNNESENSILKTNILRHQVQGKYWFGNLIRANQIHRLRCAHKIKIREDYHFKPYLLIGLDNSFLIGENINDRHKMKMVTGIGANIKKFGNISSAQLLFVELRPNFNVKKFDPNHFENDFSIEASIGLKFY